MDNKGSLMIFMAIIIAGLTIGAAIFFGRSGGDVKFLSASVSPGVNQARSIDVNNYPALGSPGAKVAITVFGDFQCHFCKTFAIEIEPLLIEKYVKTGKAKVIYRDFAFLSEESGWAAEAVHCANDQGKYFEYAEKLHSVQRGHDKSVFSRDLLKSFGQGLGLNMDRFKECFDLRKYAQKIKDSFEDGVRMGVKGTPTVFINGQKIDGVQPFSAYEKIIDEALK